MTLLKVDKLSKIFGGLTALDAVSLSIEDGEIHGLMGANGAGKTTLFSIIAGNQRPSSGTVHFAGARIDRLRPDQICRKGIARTFQIVRPFAGLTVRDNVETAMLFGQTEALSPRERDRLIGSILGECGLDGLADRVASSLTLSARKRLEVARALATGPRLLLLDEVMAGLTPTEVTDMIAALKRVKDNHGLTILIIEHVMSALNQMSDRITVLHRGQLIAEGTPEDIARNPQVAEAYFGVDDSELEGRP
ncbi:MAG: ABC transporter ATP-binding protein [Rhodobacter sp.]|nr:ABC transporter ATP-binding protein [Paracoccaceae bacterium]MCC0076256.1 ABC transporter ATP-binding protein [Rhodobacter sp.]